MRLADVPVHHAEQLATIHIEDSAVAVNLLGALGVVRRMLPSIRSSRPVRP
jgi:hypothetical protein